MSLDFSIFIPKHFTDINLELYKVFYYVANTLSFSEASRQLFISQSAVSQSKTFHG